MTEIRKTSVPAKGRNTKSFLSRPFQLHIAPYPAVKRGISVI
ncbi:hypothetical protein MPF_0518 [Methanohalophilus portucalensis FDF-1]|uniref:Uncharacterized protein n=1 Tax=Methanohalophilus portucalensis FDF-1 TaxID=523843 RepID=A0A1L9C5C9_9EURY|nr:hypothetical protein MPF_0518 [Methanohalophilus portucalensis FDF-1]